MRIKKQFSKLVVALVLIMGIMFPSHVSFAASVVSSLEDGDIVYMKCLGNVEGNRWLDGRTGDGSVGLAPQTNGGYTGTRWMVHVDENGNYMFECLGNIAGNRWLDGRTGDGTVGLAPVNTGDYTGTRWLVIYSASDATFKFYCLGHVQGNKWLDGRTGDGTVGLAPSTTGGYTGTKWSVYKLN